MVVAISLSTHNAPFPCLSPTPSVLCGGGGGGVWAGNPSDGRSDVLYDTASDGSSRFCRENALLLRWTQYREGKK